MDRNGRTSTKYFFNLEKRNYIKKLQRNFERWMKQLLKMRRTSWTLLRIIITTYVCLQTAQHSLITMNILGMSLSRLSGEERDNMEGLLTYEECKKVLETFQNDRSPVADGFTVEFYQFFFRTSWTPSYCKFKLGLRDK